MFEAYGQGNEIETDGRLDPSQKGYGPRCPFGRQKASLRAPSLGEALKIAAPKSASCWEIGTSGLAMRHYAGRIDALRQLQRISGFDHLISQMGGGHYDRTQTQTLGT